MATVTLDRGNYVIIGQSSNEQYSEKFGEIMDFREDEAAPGTHWLKIKMLVDINQNTLIEEIQNFSSDQLRTIAKLEVYDRNEGASILTHFTERIDQRENRRAELQQRRARQAAEVIPSPDASDTEQAVPDRPTQDIGRTLRPAVIPRMGEQVETERDDREDVPQEARPMGIMPTNIREDNSEIEPELKAFSLNLATGDMKTVMKIAEKNPKKVFSIIDRAIEENGHNTLNYIDESLRGIFIDLKIEHMKEFTTITLEKNAPYSFSTMDYSFYAYYMGDNFWVIPQEGNHAEGIQPGFKEIQEGILKGYNLERLTDSENIVRASCDSIIATIDVDLKDNIEANAGNATVEILNFADGSIAITEEDLGKSWVDAITYYYFMGGNIKWKMFDLESFSTSESIHKLALVKNDSDVLELLEAA